MKRECERIDCPLLGSEQCFTDTHHEFWPKSQYKKKWEKEFRNLSVYKKQICRYEHNEIHAMEIPPQKPSRQEMLGAIALYRSRFNLDTMTS